MKYTHKLEKATLLALGTGTSIACVCILGVVMIRTTVPGLWSLGAIAAAYVVCRYLAGVFAHLVKTVPSGAGMFAFVARTWGPAAGMFVIAPYLILMIVLAGVEALVVGHLLQPWLLLSFGGGGVLVPGFVLADLHRGRALEFPRPVTRYVAAGGRRCRVRRVDADPCRRRRRSLRSTSDIAAVACPFRQRRGTVSVPVHGVRAAVHANRSQRRAKDFVGAQKHRAAVGGLLWLRVAGPQRRKSPEQLGHGHRGHVPASRLGRRRYGSALCSPLRSPFVCSHRSLR